MIWGIDENEKRPNDDEPRNASMLRVVVVVDMPAFYTADHLIMIVIKNGQQINMQTIFCISHMYN